MSDLHWKIRDGDGDLIATTRYPEDAAVLVSVTGHKVWINTFRYVLVWTEGDEAFSAGESYDAAAAVMRARFEAFVEARAEGYARLHNRFPPNRLHLSDDYDRAEREIHKAAHAAAAAVNSADFNPRRT